MNAVTVITPAIKSSDLIMIHMQNKLPEHITVERQKIETIKCTTRGTENEFLQPFIEWKVAHSFRRGDLPEDGTVLLYSPIGLGLEGID